MRALSLDGERIFRPCHRQPADGWANRDLNVAPSSRRPGRSPRSQRFSARPGRCSTGSQLLGPGKFDAELSPTAKRSRIRRRTPVRRDSHHSRRLRLAGVNLHTDGVGSVTHWNAFVANLEMHGRGTFFDPPHRQRGAVPDRGGERIRKVRTLPDLITAKLADLTSISWRSRPRRPRRAASMRPGRAGGRLFRRQSGLRDVPRASALHGAGVEHAHAGGDRYRQLQADRSPDRRYRTSAKGLWTHTKGASTTMGGSGRFSTW